VRVDDVFKIGANLYVMACLPGSPLVEIRCRERILTGHSAYRPGRILVCLARAAR
jgi:hypothetical protein